MRRIREMGEDIMGVLMIALIILVFLGVSLIDGLLVRLKIIPKSALEVEDPYR